MSECKITPLTKKIIARFSGETVQLPKGIQSKIDSYWDELIASGRPYKRGEVFTIIRKDVSKDSIKLTVEETDYAHYLYCHNVESLGTHGVHTIHTASLVDTKDNYTLVGKMGSHTTRAGTYQLCCGGIDYDDLENNHFNFTHNITKELREELGIDIADSNRVTSFREAYYKDGGPTDKITVIFQVAVNQTKDEFMEQYKIFENQLIKKGEEPEFSEIIPLRKEKSAFVEFFSQEDLVLDECMRPLFAVLGEELGPEVE